MRMATAQQSRLAGTCSRTRASAVLTRTPLKSAGSSSPCQLGFSTSFFAITLTGGGSFTGQELGTLPCLGGPISGTLSNEALTFTVDPVGLTVVSFEGTRVLAALGGRQ
jgi:hypothetical protein